MTKTELIERYGEAWYEEHKRKSAEAHRTPEYTEYCRKFHAERYKDPENRRHRLDQNSEWEMKQYVEDGRIDLIENYELAKKDNFKGWCIHHRLELHPDYSIRYYRETLIELDIYLHRPSNELIFLSRSEHARIHSLSTQARLREERGIV